jgi:hypothetical protein
MSSNNRTDQRLVLICPNLSCRRRLDVPPAARGKVLRCAYCGAPFRVPKNQALSTNTMPAARVE